MAGRPRKDATVNEEKKVEPKIRVHNKGKREFEIPPAHAGGKNRMIMPGRAIELEESTALKYLELYPRELINFEDLVSGDRKDLNRENRKLADENADLKKRLAELEAKMTPAEPEGKKKED